MEIRKRNGEFEQFSSEKLMKVLEWACSGLENVEPIEILIQTKMKLKSGMKSTKVQESLIRSAVDLIDIKHLDYQYVAARLLSMHTRKQIFGKFLDKDLPHLYEVLKANTELGFYDPELITKFTKEEIDKFNDILDHNLDDKMTYAQYKKIIDSYVMKNRKTKYVYETPQYAFMVMAMAFSKTFDEVVHNYKLLSKDKSTSYATPILAGVRTTTKQYASCVLIDIDDSIESMGSSNHGIMRFIARKAGLGINFGRWRGADSGIRGGEVVHTGKIPLLRISQNAVKGFSQGGLRGGSATAFYPCWDSEFPELIVLKNDKGTEDNRLKGLDYCIQVTGYFLKKMLKNENISLFSTSDVPGLYDAWGLPEFDALYEKYVADTSIPRREIKGMDMFEAIADERQGTGKVYIMLIDNVNKHNRFLDKINQSNLCFAGDTLVAVADGRNAVKIEDLAKESNGKIKFPVYSARKNKIKKLNWKAEIKDAVAFKSGTKEVIEVVLSDGSSFKCTEDHELATNIAGEYVEAGKSLGRKLEPFFTFTNNIGNSPYRHINSISNGHSKQHILLWEHNNGKIEKGFHIDHIDPKNEIYDSIDNLQMLSKKDHMLKTSLEKSGLGNPVNNLIDKSINSNNLSSAATGKNNPRFNGIDNYELIEIGKKIFELNGDINSRIYKDYIDENPELKLPKRFSRYRFGGSMSDFFEYSKGLKTYDGEYEVKVAKKEYTEYNKPTQERITQILDNSDIHVTDIIRNNEVIDVYDLTVEDNHNFYIITKTNDDNYLNCNGVLVHNCVEIVEPTNPIQHIDDTEGEIALCNLAAVNLGIVKGRETFPLLREPLRTLVRNVDNIITIQEYPIAAASKQDFRRSLGIGVTNFAYWMAKNHFHYTDEKALPVIDELFEHFQYYLIEASMELAKELGPCEYYHRTKWAKGYMPIDDQNKNARELVGNREYSLDWEWLRKEVAKHGLRNSVLSALMPVESSSLVTNSTNGIEPPRSLVTRKGNNTSGFIPIAVPEALELAEHYTIAWELESNSCINKIVGVMQMWVDQAISVNHYYNPSFYPNNMVPKKIIMKDIMEFYKYGGKNLYYANTLDTAVHNETDDDCESCKV